MNEIGREDKEQLQKMLEEYKAGHTEQKAKYAGFWKRFAASLIDGSLMIIADSIVGIFTTAIPRAASGFYFGIIPRPHPLISFFIYWIYYAVMESSTYQATVGKMIIGIAVTDMNENRVSFFKASNRFFAKTVSAFLLFIGYIMAGFTERKQALHDIISRCLVVNK